MKNFVFGLLICIPIVSNAVSQTSVELQIEVTNIADYVLTNPAGQRSGIDPRVLDNSGHHILINEIPNSSYGYMGLGDLNSNYSEFTAEFTGSFSSPQGDGIFQIRMVGKKLGSVNLYLSFYPNDTIHAQKAHFSALKVPIAKDSVVTYLLAYHGAPGSQVSLTKVVSITSLGQDVTVMYRLGWIENQTTETKYLNFLSTVNSQLQSNNISGARTTLQTVLTNAVADSASNITDDAYTLLTSDTRYLLSQLPLSPSGFIVKLINSSGANLTGGSLQYYDGSWKDAVNNNDGTFSINSTQHTLSLRMTYAYGTQTKSNLPVGSDTVVFQTVAAQVKLQNSQSNLIDTGTVQYYAGAWRDFGATINGIATKELLPVNYSFRMTYAFASNDKAQDLSSNSIVTFQTLNSSVQLKDSQGNLIDQGTVQYYSGAWRVFGVTASGVATKELLPNNYSFRMTYAYASNDKQQDINSNATVVFQTVNASVQLKNSQGTFIDTGTVQYYSGAWRTFGTTTNGATAKELLPNNYSFRMTYAYASNDKQQNIGTNATVVFQTVSASVQLKNGQGNLIDQGTVQFYSGAWRDFGATTGGTIAKELLPNSYQFRMTYAYVSNDKTQDVGSNNIVSYSTVLTTVRVKDTLNNPVNNAIVTYYSGAWRQFGNTVNGDMTKELLPANLQFRAKLGSVQQDKTQNLSANPLVEISLNLAQ